MKRQTRCMISIIIAVLLVASVAIPAMATFSGSNYCGDYYYTYTIQKKSTSGVAGISTPHTPTYVTAKAVNNVKHPITNKDTTITSSITGYASAAAVAGNTMTVNGTSYTRTIYSTTAEFKVGNTIVLREGEVTDG